MRILHCVPSLDDSDGGPARSVPALAAAQAACGADVRICTRTMPTIDISGYTGIGFVSGDLADVLCANWLPDLVHDHGVWRRSNHLSAKVARNKRIPRIVSPRGMLEPWCLQHHRLRKQAAWKLYQHRDLLSCTSLHATSEAEAVQFRRLGLNQPVIILPNGVSLPESQHQQHVDNQSTKREVVFLSRIHPKKGLLNLITAWKQVARDGWQLRIVGSDEGGHRREIENAVTENALQGSVMVSDPVYSEEKWDLLRNADVMVLPSFSENFGIVVAEALAVGTPVITTTGTPWSKLQEHRCGWYVEPTSEGIAASLSTAMSSSREELAAMGDRGRRWVRQEFQWSEIGHRMLQSYEWLLSRSPADDRAPQACVETLQPAA